MRVAIYFTPAADHPLTRAAVAWLGRDIHGGAVPVGRPAAFGRHVASARRYGFHATIKAPFTLADGRDLDGLAAALATFCAQRPPVTVAALDLARISDFFALVPARTHPELDRLAADAVTGFDGFRAPLTDAERAARAPERLSAAERANLDRWGYPYVMEAFRFHMTLAGALNAGHAGAVEAELRTRFGPFIGAPLTVDTLSVCVERDEPGDFLVHATAPLTGQPQVG